ncbi:hypothetical protein ABT215_16050 [Streptomyces sp900105755]|uniref:hypothetical protein n=1 Tax=unclassified Streptomyces TaxID=2593676 RepID=UPI000896D275|nr:hypothetical protein [Streptomyces sp. Ag109_O5-10]SEF14969.1 hypothetical protein SAMN05216533_7237 [Streptomyces sp. Ag109_O5-10]
MPRSPRSTAPFAGRRVRAAVAGAIGRGSRPPVPARPAAAPPGDAPGGAPVCAEVSA